MNYLYFPKNLKPYLSKLKDKYVLYNLNIKSDYTNVYSTFSKKDTETLLKLLNYQTKNIKKISNNMVIKDSLVLDSIENFINLKNNLIKNNLINKNFKGGKRVTFAERNTVKSTAKINRNLRKKYGKPQKIRQKSKKSNIKHNKKC